jgi:hypothetical protein
MRRFVYMRIGAAYLRGRQRPQKNVLKDGHLSNQGTSFSRCHLRAAVGDGLYDS